MGELWLNGDGGEGVGMDGETKGLKASTGNIRVCKGEVSLRVTSHPPFIAFYLLYLLSNLFAF